jgi:hypothetical protein
MASDTFPYYQANPDPDIQRGAIYEFRPVMWLKPPLWIAEGIQFGNPGSADLYNWSNHSQRFFHSHDKKHQEYVLADAKVRPVIVLSNERELRVSSFSRILVAPLYTLRPENRWYKTIRDNKKPEAFYLPPYEDDSDQRERFADFLQIHRMDRRFLESGNKFSYGLTTTATNALLKKYKNYLSL